MTASTDVAAPRAPVRGGERVTVLRPRTGRPSWGLRELWESRELVFFLAQRDVKVRYKQTLLGAGWVLLQPLATTVVFSIFFGRLAKVPSDGVPYPLFSLTGLIPWTFFATALATCALSLVQNVNMVSKVYFPRLAIPLAAVLASVVDLLVGFVLLVVVAVSYGHLPGLRTLAVAPLLVLDVLAVVGVGLFLAALNVRFRDVRYVVPFLVQLWLFATPIAYPASLVGSGWRLGYAVNPMVGVVEGFRWAMLGDDESVLGLLGVSTASALVLLVVGWRFFRSQERVFADVI